jgi:hypothetical protein
MPLRLQAAQVPHELIVQQTPSTQLPLPHWLPPLQVVPGAPFVVQAPLLQKFPAEQSVSAVQLVLQAVAPQRYLPQGMVAAVGQVPEPEQKVASVAVPLFVSPLHEALPHIRVVGCCWQAPLPVQAPVLPQTPLVGQRPCGSVTFAGTLEQVPRLPVTLQAMQVRQELVPQQTPSTQKPLLHSWFVPQATPFALTGMQLPLVAVQ